MTFHHMCVHFIFSLVWLAEWPPFGKELLTQLTIWSLCILKIGLSVQSSKVTTRIVTSKQ